MQEKVGHTHLDDITRIVEGTRSLWKEQKNPKLFFTGGTGFVGGWMLRSFLEANRRLGLNGSATVLTRDVSRLKTAFPDVVGDAAVTWLEGDVRSFSFPKAEFTHIVHAATPASAKLNDESPLEMMAIVVDGTRRIVELAQSLRGVKLLHMSSGAIYGSAPLESPRLSEEWRGGPDCLNLRHMYAESRRMAEMIVAAGAAKTGAGYEWVVARGFAFVGPGLPLDTHFAIGNFIYDVLNHRPIQIKGDGSPQRSYLYATDMAAWLWTLLFKGQSGQAYNVGSEKMVSIRDLADLVAEVVSGLVGDKKPTVLVANDAKEKRHDFYVPSTEKARALGLTETVPLREGILRTASAYVTKKR